MGEVKHFKVTIEHCERRHKFSCGTDGTVADSVNIGISMTKDCNLQTHADFYTELERIVTEHIEFEIEGYLENCDY